MPFNATSNTKSPSNRGQQPPKKKKSEGGQAPYPKPKQNN